ncbi:MAG: PH domain-containing protein [Bryobacteraceae bacterium]|jgi:putative membrane protein
MADLEVQPTRKWIRFQYTTVFILFCVAVFLYVNYFPGATAWVLILPALLFLYPIAGSIRRHFTRMTFAGDKLRYQVGMLSKTTRTIQISKIQDVTVIQSLGQRLIGVGTLSIETAGETSRLTIENIDEPRVVAEELLDAAQGHPPLEERPAAGGGKPAQAGPKKKGDRG